VEEERVKNWFRMRRLRTWGNGSVEHWGKKGGWKMMLAACCTRAPQDWAFYILPRAAMLFFFRKVYN
jgi:hypothetical protein